MTLKKLLHNFEEYFCVWIMAIMTILVFFQVVMVCILDSLSWSEELARFIFLWLSWMGASYAVRERSHFRVEMFINMIKGKTRVFFEYIILLAWFSFCFFLAWQGTKLLVFLQGTGQISTAMSMPMTWPYASVPVASTLMCVRLIIEMYALHKRGLPKPANPAVDVLE